jgi:hypothetical protein
VDAGTADRATAAELALRARGVITSARGRAVRIAPHGFTTDEELVHALRELASILAEPA